MKIFKIQAVVLSVTIATLMGCQSHYALVKSGRGEYHIDSTVKVDSGVIKAYLPYKQKMEKQMSAVLGTSAKNMEPNYDRESLLGNFYADAAASEAKKLVAFDFAMPTTKGGLRYAIPQGNITLSTIFELMPFENELLLIKLKGTDVEELLNFIAASDGQPVNGIRLKIKDKKPVEVSINGQPFDRNKTYLVLTSDYLANGGDNTKGFANSIERKPIGLRVRDALINYVKQQTAAGKQINAQLDGRITKN